MPPERDGGLGEPVACLASTYTFHAALFENELAPRFLGLKYDRTEREALFVLEREDRLATVTAAVFVDASQVDAGQSTGRWLQVPVAVPRGCQHAKVSLLAWERFVRVIVASANLTTSGYRKNREMAAVLDFFDGEESSPRELLAEVLEFVEELITYGNMPSGTRQRLAECLEGIRASARGWRMLPQRSERLPSVAFVPVLPPRDGRASRGALDAVVNAWGNRKASDISVMTPFVGDSPNAVRTTMQSLLKIPRSRAATGHLVIGGRPSADDEAEFIVDLPAWFRDEWANAWRRDVADLPVYVVPPQRDGEPKAIRALHAKAILVESDERTLLLAGSSNFSPHGLGIGVFNIEANLCFTVREREDAARLTGALPVDWRHERAAKLIWLDEPPFAAEDAPSSLPPLPAVFAWATYHDRTGVLTVGLDRAHAFPSYWAIRVPGVDRVVMNTGHPAVGPTHETIPLDLADDCRSRRITSIVIEWVDGDGLRREARLPTLVADDDELLAPEEFRSLTCDGILDCILSGRDPVEWREPRSPGTNGSPRDLYDPLKAIDTSAYVLYRTRRLGRALAALSRRLLATLRTTTAIRHRLQRDPIGPVMLAEAMVRDTQRGDDTDCASTVFALTELMLCLAHVGQRIDRTGKLRLLPLFRDTLAMLEDLRRQSRPVSLTSTDPLAVYIGAADAKCEGLLAFSVKGESRAG